MWLSRAISCLLAVWRPGVHLSLITCFLTLMFHCSQGSVATYARCGRSFNNHFTANLLKNLSGNFFENRLRFDRIMTMRLLRRFLAYRVFRNWLAAVSLKTFE